MIKLEKGGMICPECNGTGISEYVQEINIQNYQTITGKTFCKKCLGNGKLDWIENLVGKENPLNNVQMFNESIPQDLIDELYKNMSEHLAKDIDKRIMYDINLEKLLGK